MGQSSFIQCTLDAATVYIGCECLNCRKIAIALKMPEKANRRRKLVTSPDFNTHCGAVQFSLGTFSKRT